MDRMLPFLITGAVLLVGWVVFAAIRAEQQKRRDLLEAARNLGFTPAASDPGLAARLTELYVHTPSKSKHSAKPPYKLQNVFKKRMSEGDVFIFDLVDTSGDDSSQTEKHAVAIVSPRLDLPRFVMLPRIGGSSALAPVANKVLAWVARNYGSPVDFPHAPEFAQHFMVCSVDPEATRRFLSGDRLRRLAEMRNVGMHAGGHMFTVTHYAMSTREPVRQKLRERVDDAMRILSSLGAS